MDEPILFRASSVGTLLSGGTEISSKQLERLHELEARANDPEAKDLTTRMETELSDLREKRAAPFQLGASAKELVRKMWLKREHGYEEIISSPEMQKGIECEDEALLMLNRQIDDGPFRIKNTRQFSDAYFSGEPDCIAGDTIEDVKCSFTVSTFMDAHPSVLYTAQGQVYMHLTGRKKFRLVYCLCQTPFEIIQELKKRHYFMHDCDEDSPALLEAYRVVEAQHNIDHIPESKRVKIFEVDYSEAYIMKLQKRIDAARIYYSSLTL